VVVRQALLLVRSKQETSAAPFSDLEGLNKIFIRPQDLKYEKQDQQGKAAFNERNPHMTQQQEPMARSPGGPQT
jgi:hypothetical protein